MYLRKQHVPSVEQYSRKMMKINEKITQISNLLATRHVFHQRESAAKRKRYEKEFPEGGRHNEAALVCHGENPQEIDEN